MPHTAKSKAWLHQFTQIVFSSGMNEAKIHCRLLQCCEGKGWQNHVLNIWVTSEQLQVVCALACNEMMIHTLQGTNISHLGKRKIIFKMPFLGYVSSLEGMAWFCISFWSFVSCFWGANFTELWRKGSWVLIHLSLWMLLGLVGGACQLPLPHWNLHVVSSKTFCCFRLSLSTMTNITWYAAQTSSPKYKVSPPDVCIGLHKWRVAQHITSSHLGRSHSHAFYRGGKNLPACCMCKFHNHDSDG